MSLQTFVDTLLRVPLAGKIAGANALLTIALAVGFFAFPAGSNGTVLLPGLVVAAMLAAGVVNVMLIAIALRPIQDLERAAERVWSGATDARVPTSPVADSDLRRVARTVNSLLEKLAADRARLQSLTEKLISARSWERSAIAQELTESVAQSLAALALECEALKSRMSDAQVIERIDRMGHALSSTVEEIRRIVRDVHPRHIDDLGLAVAIQSLVREAGADPDLNVSFETHGVEATAQAVPSNVAGALYDVAREALRNVHAHSGANRVTVSLDVQPHAARLTITDDGCGFAPDVEMPNGTAGLSIIRERTALVGGTLDIQSHSGRGTRLLATVPLPQESSKGRISTPQQERIYG
jgi:signal transduction histidine kinase